MIMGGKFTITAIIIINQGLRIGRGGSCRSNNQDDAPFWNGKISETKLGVENRIKPNDLSVLPNPLSISFSFVSYFSLFPFSYIILDSFLPFSLKSLGSHKRKM